MGSIEHRSEELAHVALLAFPFGTHAAPLFSLGRALAAAAPHASFSFHGSARANAPLHASALPNLRLYEVADGGVEGGPPAHPEVEVGRFLELTPGNFQSTIAEAEADAGRKVTCMVSDGFLWFTVELAAEVGAPWIALWTGGPSSLSSHMYTDLLRQKIGTGEEAISAKQDEHLSFLPGFSALRVRDLPEGIVAGNLTSSFARLLHRVASELPRASAVVFNTFHGLDPGLDSDFKSQFKCTLPIGPLHLLFPSPAAISDEHNILPWLNTQDTSSVAYISFGSMLLPSSKELMAIAEGLESSGVPFIWSLKDKARESLPQGFLNQTRGRGHVVSWAPQVEILQHEAVGAFVTHCGWNSVMEGIAGGVPMISCPFLGDQRLNARIISHVWKIGVGFEGGVVTKENVVSALNEVLKGDEGKKMRVRVGELKAKAAAATAARGSSAENFKKLVEMVCE